MDNQKNHGSNLLVIGALAIAAIFLMLYFGYAFADKPPFWTIDPQNNANFTLLYCLLEKIFYLSIAGFVAIMATSIGYVVLRALGLGDLPAVETTGLSLGIGLGVFSLVTLGAGLLGVAVRTATVLTLIASVLAGLLAVYRWTERVERHKAWQRLSTGRATGTIGVIGAILGGLLLAVYEGKAQEVSWVDSARRLGEWAVLWALAAMAVRLVAFVLMGLMALHPWTKRVEAHGGDPWSPAEKVFGVIAAAAGVLTLVYSFNPPMDFDVLEYHLGAPAYWFSHSAIRYIEYNAYSNFPSNAEMLYLFSMALTGSKLAGAIVGKVLNAYVAIAAAGAAFALGRWMLSRSAGVFAAAALLVSEGFFQVATAGYVEPLQVLYTILAVLAAGRFIEEGGWGLLTASAILTGLAMCVKYTSAPFLAVPLALAVLLRKGSAWERLRHAVVFSAIAIAVLSPWLIKNLIFTGNPLYPLLYSLFGGRDWSALQDARWQLAHTPKGGLALEQWARHVFATFFSNEMVTFLSFAFAPLVFVTRSATKRVMFVLCFGLLYVFLWFALTHRIDRFLLPGIAVLGAVSGVGLFSLPRGNTRAVIMSLAFGLAILGVFYLGGLYGSAMGLDPSVPLFGNDSKFLKDKVPGYEAWVYVNDNVPPHSKVMLVGEAEDFYLNVDYSGATVFDRKPLEEMIEKAKGDAKTVCEAVKASGSSYIFVNWATFRRQQETYGFQYNGRAYAGYSDVISPALFDAMAAAGTIRLVYSSGPEVYPGAHAYVLYSVE
jgi:hypothetical protein